MKQAGEIEFLNAGDDARSLLLAFAEMVAESGYDLFEGNLESLGDSQQCGDGDGASGLNHLPVTRTEAAGEHVLLAQVAIVSVGSNPVAQGAEEPRVTGGEFSAGAHSSRVRPARAKIPRANIRIVRYTGKRMERIEKWLQSLDSRDQFRLALLCGLIETTLVFWILSLLPPPPFCDPGEVVYPPGLCMHEPRAADAPGGVGRTARPEAGRE